MLRARNPATLEVCALLTKPERREIDLPIRYVGFEIPNRFAIGYGLDHAERFRNLPYVAVLSRGKRAKRGPLHRCYAVRFTPSALETNRRAVRTV